MGVFTDRSAYGKDDCLPISLLAGDDVVTDLGAVEKFGAGECGAVVAGVGKVDFGLTSIAVDHGQEGEGNDVDIRVCAVGGQVLLGKAAAALPVGVLAPVDGNVGGGRGVEAGVGSIDKGQASGQGGER